VIRRHGGEAAAVTRAYVGLGPDDQEKIIDFLQTLILFPPDDTASNLNPGVPSSDDPQLPGNHGSIALSGLFQISSEGVGSHEIRNRCDPDAKSSPYEITMCNKANRRVEISVEYRK